MVGPNMAIHFLLVQDRVQPTVAILKESNGWQPQPAGATPLSIAGY